MRLDLGEDMQVDVERNCRHERNKRPHGVARTMEIWAKFVENADDVIIGEQLSCYCGIKSS
jgi:hypothetical protein